MALSHAVSEQDGPEFSLVRNGYDPQAVNRYLADREEVWNQQSARMAQRIADLEAVSGQTDAQAIGEAMIQAQKAARQIIAEAEDAAATRLVEADAEAVRRTQTAEAQLQSVLERHQTADRAFREVVGQMRRTVEELSLQFVQRLAALEQEMAPLSGSEAVPALQWSGDDDGQMAVGSSSDDDAGARL